MAQSLFMILITLIPAVAQAQQAPGAASPAEQARPLNAKDTPVNTWTAVEEHPAGGAAVGLVYLPDQNGMLLWGRRDGKGDKPYWAEVFDIAAGKWVERVPQAGRIQSWNSRGSNYTQWKTENGYTYPFLPHQNAGFWGSHQMCYLPDEKKVLYFWGGATFKYDPASRSFEDMKISFGKAPPDVMLGSMAWDPANKEAILFGGGYIRAYRARPGDIKQERPADAWTPDTWDRRATWAYSPAKNEWRKLETASKDIYAANATLVEAEQQMQTLWGLGRAAAFEYAKAVLAVDIGEIEAAAQTFAFKLAEFGKTQAGKGSNDYEKSQFAAAASIIDKDIVPALKQASADLEAGDGWKAFRSLETARVKLLDAQEAVATAPLFRNYARMVTDPINKKIVLWGGDSEDRHLADTWLLDLATHRWERVKTDVHPAPVGSAMVAMDYDAKNKVVVLAHQAGQLWTFDVAARKWTQLAMAGEFARKGKGQTWMSIEYSPADDLHVLINCGGATMNPNASPRITQTLRLDVASAKAVEVKPGGPEEVWRPQYGQGSSGPADKYNLAWSFLPKTQSEYHEKVAAHKKVLDAVQPNVWTRLPQVYSGFGRAYGSFCYDWDRDQILLWGGGHSAYMGNEWSQYDLASNLWMESWNPEFPEHPFGSPDGDGWDPPMQHAKGSHHGYHGYVYSARLHAVLFGGSVVYDPDLMRYRPTAIEVKSEAFRQSVGASVEMNGDSRSFSVSAQHWYGGPFGVWQLDAKPPMKLARIEKSDTPFGTNDRAKWVFDTKRNRILCYGTKTGKNNVCNELWAWSIADAKWTKIEPNVEPAGENAPAIDAWNYCYSTKHDCLLIPTKAATWLYDCGTNVMRKLDIKPQATAAGVVYSPRQDLFYMLDGDGYRQQHVWVLRLKLDK